MKKHLLFPVLLAAYALLPSCNTESKKTTTETTEKPTTEMVQALAPGIISENLPNPGIPGFHFPDSTHIQNWVNTNQADSVNLHGWGLWTALTSFSPTQTYNGQKLRIFETWQTKYELDSLMRLTAQKSPTMLLARRGPAPKRVPTTPAQFRRDPRNLRLLTAHSMVADGTSAPVLEVVSYSPSLASVILNNKLFWTSSLQKLLAAGGTHIPGFSASNASIKPMYEIVPGPTTSTGLYKMKVWTGAPHTTPNPAGFGQKDWSACVYVDIQNRIRPNKAQGSQLICTTATPANTYNLTDFIYYALTDAEAKALNEAQSPSKRIAKGGDYAILVGMHITSNEINDWTWQTMWWSPNPDRSYDPSSPAVVAARPRQLTGAPRHYAMSISYQMIDPATATSNVGRSVYTYNPYLEAPFSASTFTGNTANVVTNGITINNNFGIRTNCMTCHMQATYGPSLSKVGTKYRTLPYIGDTYINPAMPRFTGMLRTNFLWSIADLSTNSGDTLR